MKSWYDLKPEEQATLIKNFENGYGKIPTPNIFVIFLSLIGAFISINLLIGYADYEFYDDGTIGAIIFSIILFCLSIYGIFGNVFKKKKWEREFYKYLYAHKIIR